MLPVNWRSRSDGLAERQVPLAPHTTWRIGGEADLFVTPRSTEELAAVLEALWRSGDAWRVIGGGSNLLVSDRGLREVVLHLGSMNAITVDGNLVRAEAGANLHGVVRAAADAGLAGAEPLGGIPGTVGGAIFGNAGGRYGDIGSLVCELELIARDGTREVIQPGRDFFRYRKSEIGDRLVAAATLRLLPGDRNRVRARTTEILRERRASQPGWVGNAGCVFKNPDGGSAGQLIDAAGAKNLLHGGIVVSSIHANFFENPHRDGTAEDVLRLVDKVRATVRRAHGVELEWEVRRWGF